MEFNISHYTLTIPYIIRGDKTGVNLKVYNCIDTGIPIHYIYEEPDNMRLFKMSDSGEYGCPDRRFLNDRGDGICQQ